MTIRKKALSGLQVRPHHTAYAVFGTGGLRWDRIFILAIDMTLWLAFVIAVFVLHDISAERAQMTSQHPWVQTSQGFLN